MKSEKKTMRLSAVVVATLCLLGSGSLWAGDGANAAAGGTPRNAAEISELKQELKAEMTRIQALEERIDSVQPAEGGRGDVASLRQEIRAEESHLAAMEEELAASAGSDQPPPEEPVAAASVHSSPQPSQDTDGSRADDLKKIYDGGFYVKSDDGAFSLRVNGLFQPRFTDFNAGSSATALGGPSTNVANFDIFLGRLALSGSIFDPSIKYFVQFQGSTAGNTNGTNFIDWFAQKEFSKALSIQMGRSWTPYSLENLDSPGQYLFADFSSAEYAFALSRAVGFEALGQEGRLGYALMIANSVPGLDAAGQENFNNKVAYIGHVQYDVLAPYGYQESDPKGAASPELTIWSSLGYNPIGAGSSFSNETDGDRTVNGNLTVAFRMKYFTLQNTGFYRDTIRTGFSNFNSWGYAEQGGYYIVPGKFEFAARISGVNWGAPDFLGITLGADTNTWYSGPNFPFHRITENSFGVNYYLHGHNAKFQWDYSYLTGNTFTGKDFNANRLWLQAQVMF
jgi:hypothetical protein